MPTGGVMSPRATPARQRVCGVSTRVMVLLGAERRVQPLQQAVHLAGGFGVEVPGVRRPPAVTREEAALDEDVLFDRQEPVESSLHLQRDNLADREIDAVGRVLVAAAKGTP